MILAGVILGAAYGGLLARRREGSRLDVAHYAGIYAIVFGLVAVVLQIAIGRLA